MVTIVLLQEKIFILFKKKKVFLLKVEQQGCSSLSVLPFRNDVIEDNDTGSSENTGDCSEVLVCTDLDSEAMKHGTATEEEESVQVRRASCV